MKLIVLISIVFISNSLFAQLVNDFRVNTDTALSVPKYFAKISSNKKRYSVIVWQNGVNSPIDVYAQIFDSSFNRIGNNFKVNSTSGSINSDVAVRKDGSFGIVWRGVSVSPSGSLILLKIYNKDGIPISQEIQLNDTIKGFDPNIRIGTDNLNRFIISFDYTAPVSYHKDIFFQIVDSNGVKVGNNVKVNQYSSYGKPAIGVQQNGGFVIAWESSGPKPNHFDIYSQLFSANGTPIGSNQQVNDIEFDIDTLNNQTQTDIAIDSTGNYVISFSEFPYSTGVDRIKYQRYNNSGNKIGINKIIGNGAYEAFVSYDEVGNIIFLLSYDGSVGYINNLRIDNNDNFIGSYFPVSTQFPNSSKGGSDVLLIDKKIVNVWRDLRLSNQPQIFLNVRSYINPDSVVSINNISMEVPSKYSLSQNYPNPFNPTSVIRFQLPFVSFISLKVYDIQGKEVQTLVNESLKPGTYEVTFDGSHLTSSVYFCKLQTGSFISVKRMVLLK
ncbi:MAG: T9SS type A sorting domain-containing protein [Ignavibacteria bacterium]